MTDTNRCNFDGAECDTPDRCDRFGCPREQDAVWKAEARVRPPLTQKWECLSCKFSIDVAPGETIPCRKSAVDCGLRRVNSLDLRQADVRGSTHGNFGDNAMFTLQMRDLLRSIKPHWSNLTAEQCLALDEIALKIARILSGGNDVAEHWIDIQGYAKLGEKCCKR